MKVTSASRLTSMRVLCSEAIAAASEVFRCSFRCSCVYFATYNVHYDDRQAGRTLVERALLGKMHARHYFPQNKMAQKNH